MATVSTLAVNLIARTSAFEKGMGRSRKKLSFVQRQAMATRAAVLSMARGFVIAAGIGGMGLMIKKSFDTIDATAKMSDRLGIATEDIIAFGHAANITGMDTAGMNKALETFVRRIGEVRLGTGQAKVALEKLGLTADELVNQKLADNFQIIAEKISKMENASDKAATAYFLFGRQGQQMLNFLNMGARGLDVFREEVDRLGLSFSRIDAAKVEMANDAMVRLRARFTGLAQVMAIQLAPAIEAITTQLTDMSLKGGNALQGLGEKFRGLFVFVKTFEQVIVRLGNSLKGLAGGAINLSSLFVGGSLTGRGRTMQKVAEGMKAEALAVLEKPFTADIQAGEAFDKWFDNIEKRAAEASTNISKGSLAELPALVASKSQVTAGQRLTEEMLSPMERFEKRIDKVNDLLRDGVISWKTYGRAVRSARKTLESTFDKSAKVKSADPFSGFTPATSDFGVLTSPDVSIKGLSIGGADSGIQAELKRQTTLLTVIAAKEGLE